jgi:hypothetical protein
MEEIIPEPNWLPSADPTAIPYEDDEEDEDDHDHEDDGDDDGDYDKHALDEITFGFTQPTN